MITLFIDTADKNLTVALIKDKEIMAISKEDNDVKLSSRLVPTMQELIDSKINKKDIDNIIVVNGPGSFTGTRMGVTVAKTYAWALNKKVNAVSKLELMATTPFEGDFIMPIIDARHNYVYAGLYDHNLNEIMPNLYLSIEELLSKLPKDKHIIMVSNDELNLGFKTISPIENISTIVNKHLNDEGINPHQLNPNYLKRTEAEEKLHD
jgi:tRNA threonylcarbamoyladenosine biosynthesis protein TsaB